MAATILLEAILKSEQANYPSGLNKDDLFEFYCVDNLLVNYDLGNAEIQQGIIDGPKDAGIDAAYVFVNGNLLTEDFDYSTIRQPAELELIIIQAKNEESFKETPVDRLAGSLPLLLDHTKKAEELEPLFKKEVVDVSQSFLTALSTLADRFPTISIRIFYCSKGTEPNGTVMAKATALENTIKGMQFGNVSFQFLGAQQLYERSRIQKELVMKMSVIGTPISGKNSSFVALCKLGDYVKNISDENGTVLTRIFEANVRAYQGDVDVNGEIAASLSNPTPDLDFWWLNNGVTIVCDEAGYMSNQLVIKNPLIVNGLQTSYEIHSNATSLKAEDDRTILVRVVPEKDPKKRDEIIRATNRQTNISNSSFKASEPIHMEIEDYLLTLGYFYDRRRNAYKRQGKPADKIISIDRLAQAVMSVLLQEPHIARARPTTAIKTKANYDRIFSTDKDHHPLEMYGIIVALLERVDRYFKAALSAPENRIYRNNLRFHALMVLAWALNKGQTMPPPAIKSFKINLATDDQIKAVADWVIDEFKKTDADDKSAKDVKFTEQLKKSWKMEMTTV